MTVRELLLVLNAWYINTAQQSVGLACIDREQILQEALRYHYPQLDDEAQRVARKLLGTYRKRRILNVSELEYHLDCLIATVYGVKYVHKHGTKLPAELVRQLQKTYRKENKR